MHDVLLFAASFAVCAALGPTVLSLSCQDSQSGPASGTWELPSGSGKSDGFIDGILYLAPAGTVRFYFDATLTDVFTPSLSQIKGTIDGSLDDGFGRRRTTSSGHLRRERQHGLGHVHVRDPSSGFDAGRRQDRRHVRRRAGFDHSGHVLGEWKITQ